MDKNLGFIKLFTRHIVIVELTLRHNMEAVYTYTKKAISILLCLQIILVSIPSIYIQPNCTSKSTFANTSKDKKQTDKTADEQSAPDEDDESSKNENNNFEYKLFNTHQRELALLNFQKNVFHLYNSKDKIQFHPEFSTPPPKHNAA